MKIRGSVVSYSFNFPHPSAGGLKKTKQDTSSSGSSIRVVALSQRVPTMWLLLSVSDDSDIHTAIIACIQNKKQNNGEKETKEGMGKKEGGPAATASQKQCRGSHKPQQQPDEAAATTMEPFPAK